MFDLSTFSLLLLTSSALLVLSSPLPSKKEGLSVEKTLEHSETNVNGKVTAQTKEKEKVSDPETGKVLKEVEKTENEKDGKKEGVTKVDVPGEGIHQEIHQDKKEQEQPPQELVSPAEIAQYIFNTGNFDQVKEVLASLVKEQKLSREDAESYLDVVREELELLHQEALQEVREEIEQAREEEDDAFRSLVDLTERLGEEGALRRTIYESARKLYGYYKTDGDDHAQKLLSQFTETLQKAAEVGELDRGVENEVLEIVLEAMNDVDEEERKDEDPQVEELNALKGQ
jgi:hypothetical protein